MSSNTMLSIETPVNRMKRKMETFSSILELKKLYEITMENLVKVNMAEVIAEEESGELEEAIERMKRELIPKEKKHFSPYFEWVNREVGYSLDYIEKDPRILEKQLRRAKRAVELMEERIDIHAMRMVVNDLGRDLSAAERRLEQAKGKTMEVEKEAVEAGKSFMEGNNKWCEWGLGEMEDRKEKGAEKVVKKRKLDDGSRRRSI